MRSAYRVVEAFDDVGGKVVAGRPRRFVSAAHVVVDSEVGSAVEVDCAVEAGLGDQLAPVLIAAGTGDGVFDLLEGLVLFEGSSVLGGLDLGGIWLVRLVVGLEAVGRALPVFASAAWSRSPMISVMCWPGCSIAWSAASRTRCVSRRSISFWAAVASTSFSWCA